MDYMKITVLGCGVIGKIWISYFLKKKYQVKGWLRFKKNFFDFNIISSSKNKFSYQASCNDILHLRDTDILLVTLKSFQSIKVIKKFLPNLKLNCAIVIINNGIIEYKKLKDIKQPLFLGITTHAGYSINKNVYHVFYGETYIGPGNKSQYFSITTINILNQVLPRVIWKKNIFYFIWIKLSINCIINPLSVFYNCKNGNLLKHKHKILILCNEVSCLMKKKGYSINKNNLYNHILYVIFSTKDNFSSMLQDIKNLKRSEIDQINGVIINESKNFNINVPLNKRLFNFVKNKERSLIKVYD
ncbi:apbA [Wigglesworthia glossinidia endosymbiont of Glossina brevipalpis]|uniref:2-dehydropantoate 2-reductase n=1 Tax=Wigglesworthia glossinidia brevipalpis TaxID=36870 RepID=Q8D355_WIGBR|nr:apbA [Wigglesworthia glossinidia endosymbiont of Glossina brevipalpis]